jgi:hypothetical protein
LRYVIAHDQKCWQQFRVVRCFAGTACRSLNKRWAFYPVKRVRFITLSEETCPLLALTPAVIRERCSAPRYLFCPIVVNNAAPSAANEDDDYLTEWRGSRVLRSARASSVGTMEDEEQALLRPSQAGQRRSVFDVQVGSVSSVFIGCGVPSVARPG